ncbi:MAG: hypothetical protein IJY62_04870 [Clostridia bacterium]|nr:hypothetical protein [Clostridia bacterium]
MFKRKRSRGGNALTRRLDRLADDKGRQKRKENFEKYRANRIFECRLDTPYGKIACQFVFAAHQTKKTLVCLHGYQSNLVNFISGFYPCYEKEGALQYNLCLFDFLGCGGSAGHMIAMDSRTNEVLRAVLKKTEEMFGAETEIYFHGVSFGAYHGLRFLADNPSARVCGMISDSGFADPAAQIAHILKKKFSRVFLPMFPLWYLLIFRENFKRANIGERLDLITVPLLIVHGAEDGVILPQNATVLFTGCVSKKTKTLFENVDHGLACMAYPDRYRRLLERFTDNAHKNRLALIGFMSAGKTTLGNMLADRYGLACIDTDEEIVADTAKSLDELFAESEADFRKLELEKLAEKAEAENAVLSCGGGTPQIEGSWEYLKKWTVVYLDVTPETAFQRSNGLKKYARPWQGFEELCLSRYPLFERIADHKVNAEGSLEETFAALCRLIEEHNLLNVFKEKQE